MNRKVRTPIAAILLIILNCFYFFSQIFYDYYIFYEFGHRTRAPLNSIFLFLELSLNLLLCFILLTKNRNNILLIILGDIVLLQFSRLIIPIIISDSLNFFSIIRNLLIFIAYGILFVFAIFLREKMFEKEGSSKSREIIGKLYFLPAIIHGIVAVLIYIDYFKNGYFAPLIYALKALIRDPLFFPSRPGIFVLSLIIDALILFFIAQWLKDPYSKTVQVVGTSNIGQKQDVEYDEVYCNLGKHIILCLFTFGIWNLIWIYRITKYLNKAPKTEYCDPTIQLLLCMFVPFYQIFWLYKQGQRIDAISKQKKLNNSDLATMCLILGIFIPIVAVILMQDRINLICTTKEVVEDSTKEVKNEVKEETTKEYSTIEQLKQYKELYDEGVISLEEFEAKKKQLLGI